MTDIPTFKLFGEDDPDVQAVLRPDIGYRDWSDLYTHEKRIAFRELINRNVFKNDSDFILETIDYLNLNFLIRCPGEHLHLIRRYDEYGHYNSDELEHAACKDFNDIFNGEKLDEMVMLMLSKFVKCYIYEDKLEKRRSKLIRKRKKN
jgi:hypothetical protein